MANSDVRRTNRQIVNEVQRKLGVNETSAMSTKQSNVIFDFLNDVIDECNDFGNWAQMFREVNVTAATSVGSYEIAVSSQVKNILEIHFNTQQAPLNNVDIPQMRTLQRTGGTGEPRQFSVTETSGANPIIRVYPVPGSNQNDKLFDVAYYKKNRLYEATVTADVTATPAFPSRMLVQGVYAKMLIEESGQEKTDQYSTAYQEYVRMRREAFNRFTADTGSEVSIVPTGGRYG